LALLASTARPDTPQLLRLRGDAIGQFAAGRIDEVLEANLRFAFHPEHAADERLVARYKSIVQRAGAAQLIRQNRAVMAREDARPWLAGIGCPALVVCGEADELTPPEVARELAAMLPRARLQLLPHCGHMLTLEQPQAVAALLGEWLAAL
jgi:pimeloyl-ACP methyl ester carboxylesterase